jgi:hypothetical protein
VIQTECSNRLSFVTQYNLAVDLLNVDTITGVLVRFAGSIKDGKKSTMFSSGQTPLRGDLRFDIAGPGRILRGRLSFEPLNSAASFTSGGATYSFANPGSRKVKIRPSNPDRVVALSLPTSQPFTRTATMTASVLFHDFSSPAGSFEPIAVTSSF